ncbi:MAG: DUF1048 domain-containing protein [Actinomycetota bacterium]|nr:DUF1048 domain-containing protein [Actinomycetota bacterium]
MRFLEITTGSDITREWRSIEARAGQLPADYRAAWGQIRTHLIRYSGFTGRNLTPIFDGALGLLEETAADGRDIHEVLGGDISGFCTALAGAHGARTYRDRWRARLNRNVAGKLGRLGD